MYFPENYNNTTFGTWIFDLPLEKKLFQELGKSKHPRYNSETSPKQKSFD